MADINKNFEYWTPEWGIEWPAWMVSNPDNPTILDLIYQMRSDYLRDNDYDQWDKWLSELSRIEERAREEIQDWINRETIMSWLQDLRQDVEAWRLADIDSHEWDVSDIEVQESSDIKAFLRANQWLEEYINEMQRYKDYIDWRYPSSLTLSNLKELLIIQGILKDNPDILQVISNTSWYSKYLEWVIVPSEAKETYFKSSLRILRALALDNDILDEQWFQDYIAWRNNLTPLQIEENIVTFFEQKEGLSFEETFFVWKRTIALLNLYWHRWISFKDIRDKLRDTPEELSQVSWDNDIFISPRNKDITFRLIDYFIDNAKYMSQEYWLPYEFQWLSEPDISDWDKIDWQLLPKDLASKWLAVKKEYLGNNPGFQDLVLFSWFRSPAYQFYVLCDVWYKESRTLPQVFRTVAPPFYSEHWSWNPAIDIWNFYPTNKIPWRENIDIIRNSPQFKAFVKVANEHWFYQSYPDWTINVNDWKWESWHFRYLGEK